MVTNARATDATGTTPGHKGRARRALDVIDERLGITALQYPVPEHANNLAWSLGGVTAFTLLVLIATGIFLTQYYNPVPEAANASVRYIVNRVAIGRFVRGIHFWAAEAMYVLAALHLLRVFITGSYKRPREANWLIGVGMFALVIGAIFTGTVLKWDQEGFEALGHNLEIARLLGGVGFWSTPEFSRNVSLLERLYVAHIAIIPGLILGLVTIHALLVRRHGISPDPRVPDAPQEPREPFTHHLRRVRGIRIRGARDPRCPRGALPAGDRTDPGRRHRGHQATLDVLVAVHPRERVRVEGDPVGHRRALRPADLVAVHRSEPATFVAEASDRNRIVRARPDHDLRAHHP